MRGLFELEELVEHFRRGNGRLQEGALFAAVLCEVLENLVEFRARIDDYLDGMSAKKVKNLKADLKKLHKNHAELMFDNEDDTEGEWYGLRIGDLSDPSNKMAGNWE